MIWTEVGNEKYEMGMGKCEMGVGNGNVESGRVHALTVITRDMIEIRHGYCQEVTFNGSGRIVRVRAYLDADLLCRPMAQSP